MLVIAKMRVRNTLNSAGRTFRRHLPLVSPGTKYAARPSGCFRWLHDRCAPGCDGDELIEREGAGLNRPPS